MFVFWNLKLDTHSDGRTAQHWGIPGAGQAVVRGPERGESALPAGAGRRRGNQRWEVGHVEQEADTI